MSGAKPPSGQPADNTWDNVGDFIADQVKAGARGFILGEDHRRNASIEDASAEFVRLKKETGLSTVYFEYVPRDMQDVLDKALNGDFSSQMRLRSHMERSWNYGDGEDENPQQPEGSTTTAQTRYDAMFAAHNAGLRVFGVYTDQADFKSDVYWYAQRTIAGDAVAADVILKNDDKAPFLVMIGSNHVQKGNAHNYTESGENPDGLNALLTKSGITMISLDITSEVGNGEIKPSPDQERSDYTLHRRTETTPLEPTNKTLEFIGDLGRASNILISKSNSLVATDPQEAGRVRVMSRDVAQLHDAYAECRVAPGMVDNLHDLAQRMVEAVPKLRKNEESYKLNGLITYTAEQMTQPGRIEDGAACRTENRQPAVPKGPGSP